MKTESQILKEVMIEASRLGARVFRNNVGTGYTKNGCFIRFGLCEGSTDLIGIYKGRFLAIEIKKPSGRVSEKQKKFIKMVNKNGGIAGVIRNKNNLKKLLDA